MDPFSNFYHAPAGAVAAYDRANLAAGLITPAPSFAAAFCGPAPHPAATVDATDEWNRRVHEKMAGGLSKRKAVSAVVKADPALHQAFIQAANRGRRVQ